MKNLFIKIFIFISLVFIISTIYIFIFDCWINKHDKSKQIEKELSKTEVLITGTSHTLFGLNQNRFVFNTSNISESNKSIIIDLQLIKKYYQRIPNLKYVIIPIDYFTLFYTGSNDNFCKKYWHHWGLKNDNINYFHFLDCRIIMPMEQFNKEEELSQFQEQSGLFGVLKTEDKLDSAKKRITAWHKNWMSLQDYKFVSDQLLDFTNFCNIHNYKILFIQMPTSKFIQKFYLDKYVKITRKTIANLLNMPNTYYLDYNNYTIFNNDSLYSDQDHLNGFGAEIASKLLNEKLLSISALKK